MKINKKALIGMCGGILLADILFVLIYLDFL